ncbi:MAG: YraN family protein [Thermodesulfobacteriota bacterium]
MASDNIKKGKKGEALAERFLKKKGYRILEKNYRTHFGEVDIIARDGKSLVFIEVKARSSDGFGSPLAAVGAKKQSHLTAAAGIYLQLNHIEDQPVRFDVVGITGEGTRAKIELVRNAFDAVE